jgi:hypothetical protein
VFHNDATRRRWQRIGGGLMALTFSLGLASGALASNTVSTSVIGGNRTASVADLTLPAVNYAHVDQTRTGTMILSADDASGTNAGWNVTVQASSFAYSGANNGIAIPASDFALTAAAAPAKVAGQEVDLTNGPMIPASSPVGTLDVARKVVQAQKNFGKGQYAQALGVSLLVPADSVEGTYTSTLTVTIIAGP